MFFVEGYVARRDLHRVGRRQRRMCIRDSVEDAPLAFGAVLHELKSIDAAVVKLTFIVEHVGCPGAGQVAVDVQLGVVELFLPVTRFCFLYAEEPFVDTASGDNGFSRRFGDHAVQRRVWVEVGAQARGVAGLHGGEDVVDGLVWRFCCADFWGYLGADAGCKEGFTIALLLKARDSPTKRF